MENRVFAKKNIKSYERIMNNRKKTKDVYSKKFCDEEPGGAN